MKGLMKMSGISEMPRMGIISMAPIKIKGFTGHYNTKYLAYKVNEYWFCLSCTMWAEFRGLKKVSMLYRLGENWSIGQALGYEPPPVRKKGRPFK